MTEAMSATLTFLVGYAGIAFITLSVAACIVKMCDWWLRR